MQHPSENQNPTITPRMKVSLSSITIESPFKESACSRNCDNGRDESSEPDQQQVRYAFTVKGGSDDHHRGKDRNRGQNVNPELEFLVHVCLYSIDSSTMTRRLACSPARQAPTSLDAAGQSITQSRNPPTAPPTSPLIPPMLVL